MDFLGQHYFVSGDDSAAIFCGSCNLLFVQDWVVEPCAVRLVELDQLHQEGKLVAGDVTGPYVPYAVAYDGGEREMCLPQHTCGTS